MLRPSAAAVRMADWWRGLLAEDADPFRAAAGLLLAVLTLVSVVIAAFQVDAGARAATGSRVADQIGIEAGGRDTGALIQQGSDLGVFRRWSEILFDGGWTERADQAVADPSAEPGTGGSDSGADPTPPAGTRPGDRVDPDLVATYRAIDNDLLAWIRRQSPMLQPPYFDAETSRVDIKSLEADRKIGPAVRAAEERTIALHEAADWDARATRHVTALALVAVALFFVGLSTTLSRAARRVIVAAGAAFGVGALVISVAAATAPIATVPEAAVDRVVESRIAAARTSWTSGSEVEASDHHDWQAAIAAAGEAVRLAPAYESAILARAEAQARYADALLLAATPDRDAARAHLDGALRDYRDAVRSDEASYAAWWNYGWVAYLAGDDATAIDATDRALELSPAQFTLYLNRALARLSSGDRAGSAADVDRALDVAGEARLDSNGWFFSLSDHDIGALAALRPDQADDLLAMQRRVREAAVAERVRGDVRPRPDAPPVGAIALSTLELAADGRLVAGSPVADSVPPNRIEATGVVGFRVSVTGSAIAAGDIASVRVWRDGVEQSSSRVDRPWPEGRGELGLDAASPYGRIGLALDPGDYEIGVFVDGAWRGSITATIVAPVRPAVKMTGDEFVRFLAGSGFTCGDGVAGPAGESVTACVTTGADPSSGFEVLVTALPDGAIIDVSIGLPVRLPGAAAVHAQLSGLALRVLFGGSISGPAGEWLDGRVAPATTTVDGVVFELAETIGPEGARRILRIEIPPGSR